MPWLPWPMQHKLGLILCVAQLKVATASAYIGPRFYGLPTNRPLVAIFTLLALAFLAFATEIMVDSMFCSTQSGQSNCINWPVILWCLGGFVEHPTLT